MRDMLYCTACGAEVAATAKFCKSCGARQALLDGPSPPAVDPSGAPSTPTAAAPAADLAQPVVVDLTRAPEQESTAVLPAVDPHAPEPATEVLPLGPRDGGSTPPPVGEADPEPELDPEAAATTIDQSPQIELVGQPGADIESRYAEASGERIAVGHPAEPSTASSVTDQALEDAREPADPAAATDDAVSHTPALRDERAPESTDAVTATAEPGDSSATDDVSNVAAGPAATGPSEPTETAERPEAPASEESPTHASPDPGVAHSDASGAPSPATDSASDSEEGVDARGSSSAPAFCTSCGRQFSGEEASFCGGCGAPRTAATKVTNVSTARPMARSDGEPVVGASSPPDRVAAHAPTSGGTFTAAAPARSPVPEWQASLPGPFNSIPPELLVVCGLMAAAGVFTLWPVIKTLPDIFDLLGASGIARSFGLLLLTVWVALGFFGVACLLLAWRMAHADRVARGLSYVLLGGLGGSILIGNAHETTLTLVMLAGFGAIAILAAAPAVQRFFVSEGSPQGDHPTSIVIARTLVAVWAGFLTLVGLMFLPISDLGWKYVVVGAIFLGIGIAGFVFNKRLATGDENARLVVSIGCVVYPVLLLVLGQRDPSLLLPIALVAGIAWNLWVPSDSKQFFAGGTPSI